MRRKRKNKMSTIQHRECAHKLQNAYDSLLFAETVFLNFAGQKAEVTRQVKKAKNAAMKAKSAADDMFYAFNPFVQYSPYYCGKDFEEKNTGEIKNVFQPQ